VGLNWSTFGGIEAYPGGQLASFSASTWLVGHLACKSHSQNDLYSVEWDVKSLLSHSLYVVILLISWLDLHTCN